MKYITTKGEAIKQPFFRTDLLKHWKSHGQKAKVEVCDHENAKPWDCGCSWGCAHCEQSFYCEDCDKYLTHQQRNMLSVTLVKHH